MGNCVHVCVCVCVCVCVWSQWAWMDICSLIINHFIFRGNVCAVGSVCVCVYLQRNNHACVDLHQNNRDIVVIPITAGGTDECFQSSHGLFWGKFVCVFCSVKVLKFSRSTSAICREQDGCVCVSVCLCVATYNMNTEHFWPTS